MTNLYFPKVIFNSLWGIYSTTRWLCYLNVFLHLIHFGSWPFNSNLLVFWIDLKRWKKLFLVICFNFTHPIQLLLYDCIFTAQGYALCNTPTYFLLEFVALLCLDIAIHTFWLNGDICAELVKGVHFSAQGQEMIYHHIKMQMFGHSVSTLFSWQKWKIISRKQAAKDVRYSSICNISPTYHIGPIVHSARAKSLGFLFQQRKALNWGRKRSTVNFTKKKKE